MKESTIRCTGIFRSICLLVMFFLLFSIQLTAEIPGNAAAGATFNESEWYLLVRHHGVYRGSDSFSAKPAGNHGLPERVVYPFNDQGIKLLTALGPAYGIPGKLAVTTSSELFISSDGGDNFSEIPLKDPVAGSNYITSVSPFGDSTIYLGTSFNGFFVSRDNGKSWSKLSEKVPFLYKGAGFYEEISGIAAGADGMIALATSFTSQIHTADSVDGPWESRQFPYTDEMRGLWYAGDGTLFVWGDKAVYSWDGSKWSKHTSSFHSGAETISAEKRNRLEKASGRYGIYLNPNNASGEKLKQQLDFLAENGLNTVTVDMKDDWGWLTYDSNLPQVKEANALNPRFELDGLIQACHARGIYVVGRVVVFKDKRMFNYSGNKYAIWDVNRNAPWGNRIAVKDEESGETRYEQREFWVDPFSEDIWRYNTSIAEELQQRGVDEVQFDYIRFPSDGDLSTAKYRQRREGMSRIEALESFLSIVREKISIPISTDLYGFNSWYRMGNWIGQNIELVSHYVDVICPMYYPSHFPRQFRKDLPYLERAEWIYREGSMRSSRIAEGRSLIRPYVQAFLLPFEYYMEEPEYSEYLQRQLKGMDNSPASGFTLWNNTNRYYMVTQPLNKFTGTSGQTVLDSRDSISVLE